MAKVFLIGFMGSGKTTFGKFLAKKTGNDFFDLDEYIENKYDKRITELFAEFGEDGFRKIERECLHEIPVSDNCFIATGGGTPCFFDNMEYMNRAGETVYLRTSVQELFERLALSEVKRPLIAGKTPEELEGYISDALSKREIHYMKSKYILDTDLLNPNNILESYYDMKN
jgi:shikimate kinase